MDTVQYKYTYQSTAYMMCNSVNTHTGTSAEHVQCISEELRDPVLGSSTQQCNLHLNCMMSRNLGAQHTPFLVLYASANFMHTPA